MEVVVDSQTLKLDLESIGIKGAALRHLRSLRFYVPRFYVLTSSFFESWAAVSGFEQKARFAADDITDTDELTREFERLLADVTFPESLDAQLRAALTDLEGQGSLRVVARPSRPYLSKIDSAQHLNLTSRDAVVRALAEIYREHFSAEAIEERLEKDLPVVHLKLPVIVQRFVVPDVTGLIMPYREEHGFFYIAAWKGFGFDMDFHRADHYLVNYRDLMLERFLNNTSGDVFFFSEEEGSITRTRILREEAREPFLDHDQIIEMCKLYTENESDLGGLALEFKIRGEDLSFVSLKDAKIVEKAEQALEDLRSGAVPEAPVRPPMDDARPADEPEREAGSAEKVEPEPAGPVAEPMPDASPIPAEEDALEEEATPPHARDRASHAVHDTPSAESSIEHTHDHRHEPRVAPPRAEPVEEPAPEEPEPIVHTREPSAPSVLAERESEAASAEPTAASAVSGSERASEDLAAALSRVIAKYVAINPDLERQLRLLESDLLDELRK